jgi:hypothetical protein
MSEITIEDAIRRIRIETGVAETTPGRAWRVRRLDRSREAYYLVLLGEAEATIAVAAVDTTGEVGVLSRLPGVAPHITVDAQQAVELAAAGEVPAQTEMVWMPCEASKSPLYPIWEVRTQSGIKYVDQHGKVWKELQPARPGG